MKSPTKTLLLGALATLLAAAAVPAGAQIRITEVAPWASGNAPYANDWFELTNIGAASVSLAGWRMDDSSAAFASSVALTGIANIGAGESVIFIENAAGNAGFLDAWFGSHAPAGLQFGNYTGGGVGLSTGGDGVTLFDGGGSLQASVTFGAADAISPFQTFDNAAGLNNASISQLSVLGIRGAFSAVNDAAEIGSPGSVTTAVSAVPEPEVYALMLAGFGLIGAAVRKRQR